MFLKIVRYLFVEHRLATILLFFVAYLIFSTSYFMSPKNSPVSGNDPIVILAPDQAERITRPPQHCTITGFPPRITCESPKGPRLEVANVKELLSTLTKGQFVYNRITTMWRDVPETVLLKLNLASEAVPTLPRALAGESTPGLMPVTPEMSVELRGTAGLVVDPSEAVRKRISDLAPTEWQWKVTPTKSADAELLTLTVLHSYR